MDTGTVSWLELRIDVLQDVKMKKEHKVDIKVSTIIGTEAKIVKQVSSWTSRYHVGQSGAENGSIDGEHCCKHIG